MPTACYKFERNNTSQAGFMSRNTTGTDAINALSRWESIQKNRKYEVSEDSDIFLKADLTWDNSDPNAGPDLEKFCEEFGLSRSFQK